MDKNFEEKLKELLLKGPARSGMEKVAALIVNLRYLVFIVFAIAALFCFLSIGKVKVNNDLTAFLPPQTETRQGLNVMEDEFITCGTARVMVSNLTYDTALELSERIKATEHVTDVEFDDTEAHFKNASALFIVSFDGPDTDASAKAALDSVKELVSDYDNYVLSTVGVDLSANLAGEMTGIMLIAAAVILAVLLLTSHSYFEVVIYGAVFAFAALLNMGTNYWLGEISSITNSIAVIMQLALAIDYAIIFAHRYQEEEAKGPNEKEALIRALAKSIVEIASSSLTTISGLVALTLMQFRLGYDLGIVLSKGIICSMLTVFLLMPGLILLFPRTMKKLEHRPLVPAIEGWGRFLMKKVPVFLIVFVLILPFAVVFSSKVEYAFSESTITELVPSKEREAMHRIYDTFDPSTAIALIVPSGDFQKEKTILAEVSKLDGVKSATGLANIEIEEGRVLTDRYTPRMFSELLSVDIELATLLYQAYGIKHEEYNAVLDSGNYDVPLVYMFQYLFEKIDQGVVTLDGDKVETLAKLRGQLERGVKQLSGTEKDRIVMTATVPAEGEESIALVESIRSIAEKEYGKGNVLVIGDITSARDLRESYNSDSVLINILTIAFVFIILLFTFKSPVASALLVFVIQGSIFINFSITYIDGSHCLFATNMIVSAIQMGATIDYAIVIMSRYNALKALYPKREAMAKAVSESFPTVLTSGAIMTFAGFIIAFRVSDVCIGHIGLAVGRGALISVLLVLSALPQMILLFDRLIEKTTFSIKKFDIKGVIDK